MSVASASVCIRVTLIASLVGIVLVVNSVCIHVVISISLVVVSLITSADCAVEVVLVEMALGRKILANVGDRLSVYSLRHWHVVDNYANIRRCERLW